MTEMQNVLSPKTVACLSNIHNEVLEQLLVYPRSTKTEMRLNDCLLLHVHKDITDTINLEDIAKEFVTREASTK